MGETQGLTSALLEIYSTCPYIGFRDDHILRAEILLDGPIVEDLIPINSYTIDLGSGAGLPGIPLAVRRNDLRILLLDSSRKKIEWAVEAARRLGLARVEGRVERAEVAGRDPALRGRFDAAVAKGLAPLPVLVEYAAPFLRPGGRLVAQKGRDAAAEVAEAAAAMDAVGMRLVEVRPYRLPGASDDRHIVVVEALRPCPERFPRRTGVARRRPLK